MGLRVGFVLPYLKKPCGWRSASVGTIQSLKNYAGITPVVFVSKEDTSQAHTLLSDCEIITLPCTQSMSLAVKRSWPSMISTYCKVKSSRFPRLDLVHSMEAYPTGLVGHWLARKLRVPHVITAAGTYGVRWYLSVPDRLMYQNVLRNAQYLCPISNGTLALMSQYFGNAISKTPCRVVYQGTDYHLKVPREVSLKRSPSEIPTILSVGAIKSRKGYHISLAAFAILKKQLPSARYWIVSSIDNSGYYNKLKAFIAENQLRDVEFLGVLSHEELQRCYKEARVFLLTPQEIKLNFEGFGLVYLEAGAYGLPVIGTKIGGVPEAIRHGETGLLAEPEDINGIAEALLRLLTDREYANKLGEANREWAEKLTWERFSPDQYEVYREVTNKNITARRQF